MRPWGLACACVLGACGFHGGDGATPSDAPPDAPVVDDAGDIVEDWVYPDNHVFTEPMAAFSEMGVETWKTLTPAAYIPGGLVVRAAVGQLWMSTQSNAAITWDPTTSATVAGTGLSRILYLPTTLTALPALGIAHTDQAFSLWFEGELQLAAGDHLLGAVADGVEFVDIASPAGTDFARVLTARNGIAANAVFHAAASGWYPVRIGYANKTGPGATLSFYETDGVTVSLPDRAHLRGRGEGMRGLLRDVFDDQVLATETEQLGLHGSNFIDEAHFAPPGATGEFSVHFSGEYYAHVAGSYTLHVDSDDANRVWFGDAYDDATWKRNGAANSVSDVTPTDFAVGWQPIAVDYNQQNGAAALSVALTSAPTGVNTGVLDIGDIRPVEPPAERLAVTHDATHYPVLDNTPGTPAMASLPIVGATGEVATRADVSVNGDLHWNDIDIALVRPDGVSLPLRTGGTDNLMGPQIVYVTTSDASFLGGAPMDGTWRVLVDDHGAGGGSMNMVNEVFLTLHAKGGWDSVARLATWRSPIVDLGSELIAFDYAAWIARLPTSATAAVAIRACDMSDCAGTEFQDVQSGTSPSIPPGRYLQLQVTLTSDGQAEPELQQLQLQFRRKGQ